MISAVLVTHVQFPHPPLSPRRLSRRRHRGRPAAALGRLSMPGTAGPEPRTGSGPAGPAPRPSRRSSRTRRAGASKPSGMGPRGSGHKCHRGLMSLTGGRGAARQAVDPQLTRTRGLRHLNSAPRGGASGEEERGAAAGRAVPARVTGAPAGSAQRSSLPSRCRNQCSRKAPTRSSSVGNRRMISVMSSPCGPGLGSVLRSARESHARIAARPA